MSKTAMIQARISPDLKSEVETILHEIGLSTSEAITIFFKRVKLERGIPFEVKIPSAETKEAIEELEAGRGEKFDTIEEMIESLKKDVEAP